jgi:alkylhydroperoxidase family enzyme
MTTRRTAVMSGLGLLLLLTAVVEAQESTLGLLPKAASKRGCGPSGLRAEEREATSFVFFSDKQNLKNNKTSERLPMLPNEKAWARLPGASAKIQPLPAWARLLAGPLPVTTARMLELDALHRSGNRLEPKLRGLVRWAAADANGCNYAKAVALADLRRAGASENEVRTLTGDPSRLAPEQRAAVAFARQMMRAAHAVTDDEVKQLLHYFGEERVVALVALLAHASFQDRIFLATNVQIEREGILPPLMVQFAKPKPPAGGTPPPLETAKFGSDVQDSEGRQTWSTLQEGVNRQKAKPGRIRVPSKEELHKRLGDGHPGLWQADINWSRVCYGNQPELTQAWFDCAAAFRHEAKLDRLFEQSLFWIVTRTLRCFY